MPSPNISTTEGNSSQLEITGIEMKIARKHRRCRAQMRKPRIINELAETRLNFDSLRGSQNFLQHSVKSIVDDGQPLP